VPLRKGRSFPPTICAAPFPVANKRDLFGVGQKLIGSPFGKRREEKIMDSQLEMGGMVIVGLTGGIASGKSTFSRELQEHHHLPIIDMDQLSRVVFEPGRRCYKSVVAAFPSVVQPDGQIDRNKLGEIVFKDETLRKKLNRITHMWIFIEMLKLMAYYFVTGSKIIILDSPLMLETGLNRLCHFVVLIYVPEEVQLARLQARDSLLVGDATARIASQMPLQQKLQLCDMVIDNSGPLAAVPEAALRIVTRACNTRSWFGRGLLCLTCAAIFWGGHTLLSMTH